MKLKLHERRTKTRLLSCDGACEDQCYSCSSNNTVNQLEPLKPNVHGLIDGRGNAMLEHRVSCTACGEEWVDVYRRVYPEAIDEQDAQDEWSVTL